MRSLWLRILRRRGRPPPIIFAPIVRTINAVQLCSLQFSHTCYGWGATSENISKIGDFTPTRSLWSKISGTRGRGRTPPIIFARLVRLMNALQLCRWQFSHKETVADFLQAKCIFLMKIGRFAFLRPPLGNLVATYGDHLRLIGKRVVDFVLALIELFSLGVTAEELRAIIGWKSAILLQWGSVDPKFYVEGVAPTIHSSCDKTRVNGLSCGVRRWAQLSFVLSQITRLTDRRTDWRTDRQTEFSSLDRVGITWSAVKTLHNFCRLKVLGLCIRQRPWGVLAWHLSLL